MGEVDRIDITPQTKVGELLTAYPELEELLIEIAPAFKKLRNPVLRRTVAKVTSLAQAARVGGVSVVDLVRRLRREVGQPEYAAAGSENAPDNGPGQVATAKPDWFDQSNIVQTLDARPMIEAGEQPIGQVLRDLEKLEPGQIFELVTPFEPAPLIDKAEANGMLAWTTALARDDFRTYFTPA